MPATPISSSDLCSYGCGQEAKYVNGSGKLMCGKRHQLCPAVRARNSEKAKIAHSEGRIPTDWGGKRTAWNKGLKLSMADFSYDGKGDHKKELLVERGHRCEICSLEEWLGKPITIEMDHINGDTRDNRKDNLRLLCPNCHSQTPTWKMPKAYLKFV